MTACPGIIVVLLADAAHGARGQPVFQVGQPVPSQAAHLNEGNFLAPGAAPNGQGSRSNAQHLGRFNRGQERGGFLQKFRCLRHGENTLSGLEKSPALPRKNRGYGEMVSNLDYVENEKTSNLGMISFSFSRELYGLAVEVWRECTRVLESSFPFFSQQSST